MRRLPAHKRDLDLVLGLRVVLARELHAPTVPRGPQALPPGRDGRRVLGGLWSRGSEIQPEGRVPGTRQQDLFPEDHVELPLRAFRGSHDA